MNVSGCFIESTWRGGDWYWAAGGSGAGTYSIPQIDFAASRSNQIYGASNTIIPESLKTFFCLKY